jgi:tetratricopeptide (TPR) repeat protein
MGLGEIFEFQGKRDDAIVEYRTASRLQPKNADAHYHVAWAVIKKPDCSAPDRSEALEHARLAVALGPKDGTFRTALALAEYRAGNWAESIAAAQRAIALTKGVDASNWFFLALALQQKGDRDEARKWFDKAVAWTNDKDPKNMELRQFWADAAQSLGQSGPKASDTGSPTAP